MSTIIAAIIILLLGLALAKLLGGEPRWRNQSRDFNRLYGNYRVLYKDGKWSEPMCLDVATDYASIFGGRVFFKEAMTRPQPTKEEM